MLIDKLEIIKSFPHTEVIRSVKFNLTGLNVVVDTLDERGNGIGKTTFLRLIDIALGAVEINALYKDKEQMIENKALKNFIEEDKVYVTLTLFNPLNNDYTKLEVDLFDNGERRIDNKKYSFSDYTNFLNLLLFNNTNKKPSFRQLIGKFVRIKMDGDNDKFLKFASPYTKDDEYQNIYDFLFKFQNEDTSYAILDLKKSIKDCEKEFKTIKNNFSYDSFEQINTELEAIDKTLRELKRKQKNYIDKDIILDEDKIIANRNYYVTLNEKIQQLEFDVNTIKNNIIEIETDNCDVDLDVLKTLYEETKNVIDGFKLEFNELVKFNENLRKNKLITNKKLLALKINDLNAVKAIKEKFYEDNKEEMFLIESGTVNDYLDNQAKIIECENKKGKAQEAARIYLQYENTLNECKEKLKLEEKKIDNNSFNTKITLFNDIFGSFTNKTLGSTYYLYRSKENFPLKISNAIGPFSTGNKKTAIAAFDMAYFEYAKQNGIICPYFIVHDVLENIDKKDLDKTLKLAKDLGCQYIMAMLKEKANNQKEIDSDDIILTLSNNDKLFKI